LKSNFPPETTHEPEIELLLNLLGSAIVDHSGVYVSAPITSGRRFADRSSGRKLENDASRPETDREFQRKVREANSEHARKIIDRLRSLLPKALMDPTALKDIDGWTQGDYRALWAKVIERFAGTVVFLDDWQYSNGCAYEFLVANRLDPRPSILKEDLQPLTLEKGIELLNSAVLDLQTSESPTDFLQRVLAELMKLRKSEEVFASA
jgi:hypothetical protein